MFIAMHISRFFIHTMNTLFTRYIVIISFFLSHFSSFPFELLYIFVNLHFFLFCRYLYLVFNVCYINYIMYMSSDIYLLHSKYAKAIRKPAGRMPAGFAYMDCFIPDIPHRTHRWRYIGSPQPDRKPHPPDSALRSLPEEGSRSRL